MSYPTTKEEQVKEIVKCGKDPVYFTKKYVKIQHPTRGSIPFNTYRFQDDCLSQFQKNRYNIVLKSRQLGLSTICADYAVWDAIFHRDRNILVIATKLDTAINFIKKVKFMLQSLPKWLLLPKFEDNKRSIRFTNGSTITAIPTSPDAGRSEALSTLIVDECVTGDSLIDIKDTKTGEEKKFSISALYSLLEVKNKITTSYLNNTRYQVKTPTGWQDFSGIKRSRRSDLIKIKTQSGKELTSTPEHRLSYNSTLKYVKDLRPNDFIDGEIIESVENFTTESYVYDLIDVENGHLYYTNGLISSNCAFIRDFDTIWTGLYPTISTGGSAILLSTPNGVGGQYYKLWTEAEAGQNEFNPIRLPWTVHPEHDQAWFEKETRNLRRRDIAQEFECDFISSGETYLQAEIMDQLRVNLSQPIEKSEVDRNVWIWKHPEFDHRYVISADVSRGDSGDYSAFTIIDVDEAELVAEYKGKLPPDKLADLLLEFGYRYNKALLCPENNTFGYTTCIKLREKGYPRLYYSAHKGDPFDFQSPEREDLPGFSTQQRSRVQILTNLEQLLRNNKLKIYSHRVYAELQTFVWNGIKAQASKDNHDDLIMSLAIGAWIGLGAGATSTSSSELAAALLKASGVVRREFVSEADNVGPVRNHWSSANFAAKSEYLKPQDPTKIRKSSQEINDFSWLLK